VRPNHLIPPPGPKKREPPGGQHPGGRPDGTTPGDGAEGGLPGGGGVAPVPDVRQEEGERRAQEQRGPGGAPAGHWKGARAMTPRGGGEYGSKNIFTVTYLPLPPLMAGR